MTRSMYLMGRRMMSASLEGLLGGRELVTWLLPSPLPKPLLLECTTGFDAGGFDDW